MLMLGQEGSKILSSCSISLEILSLSASTSMTPPPATHPEMSETQSTRKPHLALRHSAAGDGGSLTKAGTGL